MSARRPIAAIEQVEGLAARLPTTLTHTLDTSTLDDTTTLLSWRNEGHPIGPRGGAFGGVVYDPVNERYVHYYHDLIGGNVRIRTSDNRRHFGDDSLILAKGEVGTFDELGAGVPYLWYEAGEARPWRIIYRGMDSAQMATIGLATGVTLDSMERVGPDGSALSGPIVGLSVGGWDSAHLDHNAVIKVGDTYYLYYNRISKPRQIGLATSTDLVNWTKHADNPFLTDFIDYDDKNHDGTPGEDYGHFCPDIVFWPRPDGSDRFLLIPTHYGAPGYTKYEIYESDTPLFRKQDRTYLGTLFEVGPNVKIGGHVVEDCDTPTIYTSDITRNVVTTPGHTVLLTTALETSLGWVQSLLAHDKTLFGAVLDGVAVDSETETYVPAFDVPSTVKGMWLPGLTGTALDFSAEGQHLLGRYGLSQNGVVLDGSAHSRLEIYEASAGLAAITTDFTAEFAISFPEHFLGRGAVLGYSNGAGDHRMQAVINGLSGPSYSLEFSFSDTGNTTRTRTQSLGALVPGQVYRVAVSKVSEMMYVFLDGTLLNVGGNSSPWVIKTVDAPLRLGSTVGQNWFWTGTIDEVVISNVGKWTASYTAEPIVPAPLSEGYIFTRVYEYPAEFAVAGDGSVLSRAASALEDQSVVIGDFTNYEGLTAPYQQFAVKIEAGQSATEATTQGKWTPPSLPEPSVAYRGSVAIVHGDQSQTDKIFQCIWNGSAFTWREI